MSGFTNKEALVPRHDLNFVIKQAKDVLRDNNIHFLYTDALRYVDETKLFTTEEASNLIYRLVGESKCYRRY